MSETSLISELLSNPKAFDEQGRAYQLLQEYFKGLYVETLRPLLLHNDVFVRRAAVFVASELSWRAQDMIDEVSLLIDDPDPRIAWDAMESVMLCSTGDKVTYFTKIVHKLNSESDSLRRLAMRLISRADVFQLKNAIPHFDRLHNNPPIHVNGLTLLADIVNAKPNDIIAMLDSDIALVRYYGAIASCRIAGENRVLLEYALHNSDPDVSKFSSEALELLD